MDLGQKIRKENKTNEKARERGEEKGNSYGEIRNEILKIDKIQPETGDTTKCATDFIWMLKERDREKDATQQQRNQHDDGNYKQDEVNGQRSR